MLRSTLFSAFNLKETQTYLYNLIFVLAVTSPSLLYYKFKFCYCCIPSPWYGVCYEQNRVINKLFHTLITIISVGDVIIADPMWMSQVEGVFGPVGGLGGWGLPGGGWFGGLPGAGLGLGPVGEMKT